MTQAKPATGETPSKTERENPSDYCPVCSRRLEGRGCKLICPACGYYMSCSDYY